MVREKFFIIAHEQTESGLELKLQVNLQKGMEYIADLHSNYWKPWMPKCCNKIQFVMLKEVWWNAKVFMHTPPPPTTPFSIADLNYFCGSGATWQQAWPPQASHVVTAW